MAKHPFNLAVRFALEVMALISFGIWGYKLFEDRIGYLLAIILPLTFAALWGIFAVPNDPSRSGKTVVATPGLVRLLLELLLFGSAVWMLFNLGFKTPGWIFGVVVLLHYLASYDRIAWLLKQK